MIIETIEKNGEVFAVLPISYYEKLIDDAEMLEDVIAFDAAITRSEPAFSLEVWNEIEKLVE